MNRLSKEPTHPKRKNVATLLLFRQPQPCDGANHWPAYAQVFHDSNLTSRCHARSRQWWLILFSLDSVHPPLPIRRKKRLSLALTCLGFACTTIVARGAATRQPDLNGAESIGRQLYEQSTHASGGLSATASYAKQTATAALSKLARSKYRFEVINDPGGSRWLVYALAYSKDPDKVVFGIHYRVTVSQDGSKIESVEPLSRSALVVSKTAGIPKGAKPGPLWATSLISPTPLEVYSLLESCPPHADLCRCT